MFPEDPEPTENPEIEDPPAADPEQETPYDVYPPPIDVVYLSWPCWGFEPSGAANIYNRFGRLIACLASSACYADWYCGANGWTWAWRDYDPENPPPPEDPPVDEPEPPAP